ncbi:MAG: hypothetical protein HW421_1223 [Ignavibacteria bacterium]|nr:hypothetical protein [Ignavibacteria bacterium]
MPKLDLLSYKWKIVGYCLLIPGIILAVIRLFFDYKLKILDIHVFAVYSKYFETKFFAIIDNNITEELAGIFSFAGLFFIALSKEKVEQNNEASLVEISSIRIQSLLLTLYIYCGMVIFSFLFIYGIGILYFLLFNIYLPFVIYIIIFRYKLLIYLRKNSSIDNE